MSLLNNYNMQQVCRSCVMSYRPHLWVSYCLGAISLSAWKRNQLLIKSKVFFYSNAQISISITFLGTHLFVGRLTSPYGYRTQISHTWQPWKPLSPYPMYICVHWVDMITFKKLLVYFPWISKIVFFISPQPLLRI